jgi:hypothetical protein
LFAFAEAERQKENYESAIVKGQAKPSFDQMVERVNICLMLLLLGFDIVGFDNDINI